MSPDVSTVLTYGGLGAMVAGVYVTFGLGAGLLFAGLLLAVLGFVIHAMAHEECPLCEANTWDTTDLTDEEQTEIAESITDVHPRRFRG